MIRKAWEELAPYERSSPQLGSALAEDDRVIRLKVAEHQVKYHREQILAKMTSIANSLERAAADVRRAAEQSERYDLGSSVYRVQHDLGWLFPNLGADTLTSDLVDFLRMDAEIKRLGGSSEEAADS